MSISQETVAALEAEAEEVKPTKEPEQVAEKPEESEAEKAEEKVETEAERDARRARNRAMRDARKVRHELSEARAQLEALKSAKAETGEQDDIEKLVEERLEAKLRERDQAVQQKTLHERLESERESLPDDFDDLLQEAMEDDTLKLGPAVQKALFKSKNPGQILYHILDNPAELERLNALDEFDLGQEIAQIKTKTKKPSAAPKPASPATSASKSGAPDPSNTKAWIAWMNKQEQQRN